MWNRKRSVKLSIVVCFAFTLILTLLLFLGPWGVRMWLSLYRGLNAQSNAMRNMVNLFIACFYPCAVFAYLTLYSLIKLLINIVKEQIFIDVNVKHLRRISWCCFAVALITFVGGLFYLPYLFISIAAGFVGLLLRIFKNIMQNAVEIKAENELTI